MKKSSSEQFFLESDEEDEEKGEGGNESEFSSYSDDNDEHHQSKTGSLNPAWPQSYSLQILNVLAILVTGNPLICTVVSRPSINFLGPSSLSRIGSSFLSSSLIRRHTPEKLPSLTKPLIPSVEDETFKERPSSPQLPLPPLSRKPSSRRVIHDKKASVVHELPVSHQSSYGQAVLNGMNVLCGVGILSTPYAVKEGGWVGLFILLIFAALSFYTGILLRYCLDSQPGLETYPDIGQAAFGTAGRVFISLNHRLLQACCVEYIILETDNLSSLFPNAHINIGEFELNSHHLFALMTTLVILPTVWLRDLSVLSYLSGHAVFPNIYSSMKKPSQYPSVLLTSFGICTVLYAGAAALGYTMFGETTQSQFTLNLPKDLVASKIAVWTTVSSI
ncbi:UNVERIFIED_CONTAM: Amino acid transporter AVT1C [Sesamum radiatum]|uniref:Amino acid transporter AVT1C n=1 Tax=Sesamum radiatum TaxID=300843 RepID=A0AAW2K9V8_SESRA